ncbi:11339_t:CDS:2 [Paraglomus brasilianum]|uniref:11339_t:CDS:1 n=1 Tax=Paraglomus brasilianum TaxID=144538 RepID=A0A9N9G5L9_9GLOM|nr:11339_t:CDS:2 [Paraglomus brasilianum]
MNVSGQKMILENLDLDLSYTIEEFELINKQLKTSSIEIKGQPIDLFELNENGKLIPMPQVTVEFEAVVGEIARQLGNWNVWNRQDGIITTSQGGYDFNVGGQRKIDAPDVAFLSREVYDSLTKQQRRTFQGPPFSPIFAVKVADISKQSDFERLDFKIKNDYFAMESSVRLAWLIDPVNKKLHLYRRGMRRYPWGWRDIGGDDVLPGFTLEVWMIDEVIKKELESGSSGSSEGQGLSEMQELPERSEPSEMEESPEMSEPSEMEESSEGSEVSEESSESNLDCPKCDEIFNNYYDFMKHVESEHIRRRRRV